MGNPRSSRGGIAYTIILPGAILAALALSAIAIESVNAMRRPEWSSDVVTTAVNVVPALLAGGLVYGLTALWLRRNGWLEGGFLSHLRRSTPLYLAAVFCGAIIVRAWNSPDFWFWGQLPIWSGLSSIAGVGTDLLVVLVTRRSAGSRA